MGTLREFVFAARDPSGARIEGRIAAENSAIAVARLRAQGLNVERIRAMESPVQAAAPSPREGVERALRQTVYSAAPGVSLKDLAVLYRQMATLVSAGMPLYQVLVSLEAQTRNNRLRTILRECQAQVMAGGRLSDVLEQHRYAFSDLQIEMIRAAEQGGTLEETLTRLADYLERELNLRRLISQLTLYPKLVLLAALFILGKSFFSDGTPAFSKVIIGALGRTAYTGWDYFMDTALILIELVIAYVVITAVGRAAMVRFPSLRETWERVVVAVPGGTASVCAVRLPGLVSALFYVLRSLYWCLCESLNTTQAPAGRRVLPTQRCCLCWCCLRCCFCGMLLLLAQKKNLQDRVVILLTTTHQDTKLD